ncbi:hypothetical protein KCP76_21460 [Salmonella enterica subsp. enterica serovar Weltevreden]|nr:hypothetical protein KCP76_21460 [Salmonella enterica subsp. enterica serovar Weltevreden]
MLRSGQIRRGIAISAPPSAWRRIPRHGRWSQYRTTAQQRRLPALQRGALAVKAKGDGRGCGDCKPPPFLADMVVKESGFGELIPQAE